MPTTRAFEEKDAMSWDAIDLTSVLEVQNKKKNIQQAKKVVVVQKKSQSVIKQNINLNLTSNVQFSITKLEKLNKGFTNNAKVNCFMNVCLQSLFACPGFYNLLQAIGENSEEFGWLDENGTVMKLVHI